MCLAIVRRSFDIAARGTAGTFAAPRAATAPITSVRVICPRAPDGVMEARSIPCSLASLRTKGMARTGCVSAGSIATSTTGVAVSAIAAVVGA